MLPPTATSTLTHTRFPYTTLFRSPISGVAAPDADPAAEYRRARRREPRRVGGAPAHLARVDDIELDERVDRRAQRLHIFGAEGGLPARRPDQPIAACIVATSKHRTVFIE